MPLLSYTLQSVCKQGQRITIPAYRLLSTSNKTQETLEIQNEPKDQKKETTEKSGLASIYNTIKDSSKKLLAERKRKRLIRREISREARINRAIEYGMLK